MNLKTFEIVNREALLIGGEILRRGFSRHGRVSYKSLISPVTEIDVKSERAIIRHIRKKFKDHAFLGEESAFLKKIAPGAAHGFRWVIDPLDGTINFMHGIPMACVSIGLEYKGTLLTGGVYDPFRQELFMAARGQGATLNGKRIHVSKENKLIRSLVITGFPYDTVKNPKPYLRLVEGVIKKTIGLRRFGSAAIDLAWVACGRAEAFWEYNLSPWDVAGGWLLVQEAGGTVTDFHGNAVSINSPQRTLATNGRVHRKITAIFKKILSTS